MRGWRRSRHRGGCAPAPTSFKPTGILERQSRIAREETLVATVADIDQKIAFPPSVRKERCIQRSGIKTRHRAAIQPQCARRDDQIGTLEGGVALRGLED